MTVDRMRDTLVIGYICEVHLQPFLICKKSKISTDLRDGSCRVSESITQLYAIPD